MGVSRIYMKYSDLYLKKKNYGRLSLNPHPAGVWLVTRPAGGGGQRAPLRSPKLLDRFPNFKRHSIALYVKYPYKVKNLTWRSLMTSQVRSKSEFSTFRCLVTSASKISMLSANKAN